MIFSTSTTTTTKLGTITTTNNKAKKQKQKDLGCIILLAPQRNQRSGKDVWNNIDRFCLLLRCIRSIDQYLNSYWGPYPIYVVVTKDYMHDPLHKDGQYTLEDRELIRSWAPNSTIHFIEIDLYSGPYVLGYYEDMGGARNRNSSSTTTTSRHTSILNASTVLQWRKGYEGSVPGRDLGYTSMCRLWSGRIQQMEFVTGYHSDDGSSIIDDDEDTNDIHGGIGNGGYEYYLRMDDDSLLTSPFTYDPFMKMKQRSLWYVYKRTASDHWGIQQLWDISRPYIIQQHQQYYYTEYVQQNRHTNNNSSSSSSNTNVTHYYSLDNLPFVSVTSTAKHGLNPFNDDDDQVGEEAKSSKAAGSSAANPRIIDFSAALDHIRYYGDQPYNNFHISKVEFWNTPSWRALYEELNTKHAFYKYRVGDANVHAIAVMMMPFGTYEQWSSEIDTGDENNNFHIPYVHNSNDMIQGWAPKEWQVECQQAYDRYNITSNIQSNKSKSTNA